MRRFTSIGLKRTPDYWLIATVVVLVVLGIIFVYSASSWQSFVGTDFKTDTLVLRRHVIRLLLGTVGLIILSQIDYHAWQDWRIALLILAGPLSMLLFLTLKSGGSGAQRWFRATVEGSSIQPSEFAKLAVILYIAAWLSSKKDKIHDVLEGVMPFALLIGAAAGLIVVQPHFSATALVVLTTVLMYYVAGGDLKHLAILGAFAAISFIPIVARTYYASSRWTDFWSVVQEDTTAVGSASEQYDYIENALKGKGIFGDGPGGGDYKEMFRQAAYTDFILAVAGEELGLFGTWLIMGLFCFLGYRGLKIAAEAPDDFGALLATGITAWLIIQALVHGLVNARLGPILGMHLPFISYGGSALITEMAGIGLLISISKSAMREKESRHARHAFRRENGRPRVSATRRR
jgi:cell division protein FtsW